MDAVAHPNWRPHWPESFSIDAAWQARLERGGLALVWEDAPLSAEALEREIAQCARWLHAGDDARRPVRRGDRVMLVMDNGPPMLTAFLACQRIGAIAVPVSHRADAARLSSLVQDCTPAMLLIDDDMPAQRMDMHRQQPYHERLCTLPSAWPADMPPVPVATTDPDACALIQYTSGSTGDAKGVMISHAAALANIRAFSAVMETGPDDVFGSMLPLFHDMGLMCFGLAPLLLGCPLVLHRADALSLRAWLQGIATWRVTLTGAPDTLLALALRVMHEDETHDLDSLRMLICGSEPVHLDTIRAFARRWSVPGRIKPAYGMAELTLCATLTAADEDFAIDADGRVSNGRAIPGVTVRIHPERPGETHGEIRVRSPSAMSGYWQRSEATAEAFDADGFLRTGDIGRLDDAGRLYVLGRHHNMLIRGGVKHSPHDLENAAVSVAGIRRAAVIQTTRRDAAVMCLLEVGQPQLRDRAQLATLAERVRHAIRQRTTLSPDVCAFLPAGHIPVTDNGKVRHATLREHWQAGRLAIAWFDTDPGEA